MDGKLKMISYNIRRFGDDKFGTVIDLLKACYFLLLQEIWRYESIFVDIIK